MDVVVAALHADAGLRLEARQGPDGGIPCVQPADRAAVELVELVAIDGVVEKVGEIVVELQVGADDVSADFGLPVLARPRETAGQAEPAGGAAIGRIERAEAADEAGIERALRGLI